MGETKKKILICDDQVDVREALRLLLKTNGYVVETFAGPQEMMEAELGAASLILLDMNFTRDTTSGSEGLEWIARLRTKQVPTPVIAMTAWGDIALAVAAMQQGASDFMEKPWSNERLLQMAAKWTAVSPRKEMDGARKVQENLLPRASKVAHGFDFACRFLPAREVSGDYYDFFERPGGQFGFVVGDVSGKGVPAAMLMSNLQALFRSHAAQEGLGAAEMLGRINALFHQSTAPEAFATAFYGEFWEAEGRLDYVSCGHPAAFLRRREGRVESLEAQAMVLGAFANWEATVGSVRLGSGDRLLVLSDGAVEAQKDVDEFGEERVLGLLEATASLSPTAALGTLEEAILEFSGGHLYDDCTMLLLVLR